MIAVPERCRALLPEFPAQVAQLMDRSAELVNQGSTVLSQRRESGEEVKEAIGMISAPGRSAVGLLRMIRFRHWSPHLLNVHPPLSGVFHG